MGPLENESGSMTETNSDTAEVLNKFFKSVFVFEDGYKISDFTEDLGIIEPLRTIHITPASVF